MTQRRELLFTQADVRTRPRPLRPTFPQRTRTSPRAALHLNIPIDLVHVTVIGASQRLSPSRDSRLT